MLIFVSLILFLSVLTYLWVDRRYNYWKNLGFPQFMPVQFPYGNLKEVIFKKIHHSELAQILYEKFKGKAKAVGYFMLVAPILYVVDLDLIKSILIKDFNNFVDRGIYFNAKSEPLSANLFFIHGDYWRTMRLKLTPTFTSGKMKMMFNTVLGLSEDMVSYFEKNTGEINIKDTMARFTTDVIGNIAFGLDLKCMETPDSKFRNIGKLVFDSFNLVKQFFLGTYYKYTKHIGFKLFPTECTDFFTDTIKETIEYREANNIQRKDFLHMMLQLKNQGKLDEDETIVRKLTFNEVAAQCFLFYNAGFETSSSLMTFCLYELAQNQEVQEKLRKEVQEVLERFDGKITYESLKEMTYLQMCLDESLRMYPPVDFLMRKTINDYKIPESDLVIPKDTVLMIPVYAIQRDPDIFPDPTKFDPERFTEEEKINRHPMAHLPFGDGPRNCIGERFGLMQSKIGMIQLITKFKFSVSDKTPIPMKYQLSGFSLTSDKDVYLNVQKL